VNEEKRLVFQAILARCVEDVNKFQILIRSTSSRVISHRRCERRVCWCAGFVARYGLGIFEGTAFQDAFPDHSPVHTVT